MKNVLVISSSPRKGGNSDVLCDEFVRGAIESGNKAEKVFLRDLKIGYCLDCGGCNGKSGCVQQDDADTLIDKMIAADVIVLATPVYFYTMCGQLKTLIDRTVSKYTQIQDKDFYYILTAADSDEASMEKTVESIRGFTLDCLTGAKEKGIIYGLGVWQKGEIQNNPAMEEALKMGQNV